MVLSAFCNHASNRLGSASTSVIGRSRRFQAATATMTRRSISIGTDLTADSESSFQTARPWHMTETDSNLAVDNAVSMSDLFRGKTVAVFGIPAPFTGTCTTAHYPPYQNLQDQFVAKGVDTIVCYSVADPYAHYNWGKAMGNDFDKIAFLADVDGAWARSHDLERDYTGSSLGHRSARFSMVVEDGIVKAFNMVEDADADAQTLLEQV